MDGWTCRAGARIYVENGRVTYGLQRGADGYSMTAYPYKRDKKSGVWFKVSQALTADAFFRGMRNGTVKLI